jgi:hypothetical protein
MKFTTCSGLPVKLLAQFRVLRRDADGAGVEVADAHHDAAQRDERCGGEAELLGAEQRGDATSRPVLSWPSVSTPTRLRRLFSTSVWCVSARPSSHGQPGVLDRGQRRSAGAAVVPAISRMIGVRLGHARGDRADADFGDELHADARAWRLAFFRSWMSSARSSME